MRLQRYDNFRRRLMPDQRLLQNTLGGAPSRIFRASFGMVADGAHFPWIALIWPGVMPTPTWRVIVRSVVIQSETTPTFGSLFWTKGPPSTFTLQTNGAPVNEDGGGFGGAIQSICYLGSKLSATVNEGDIFNNQYGLGTGIQQPTDFNEWVAASTIPLSNRGLASGATPILAASSNQTAGTAAFRAWFEWEEIP